jgi:hypothetical protein
MPLARPQDLVPDRVRKACWIACDGMTMIGSSSLAPFHTVQRDQRPSLKELDAWRKS